MHAEWYHQVLISIVPGIVIFAVSSGILFFILVYQLRRFKHKQKLPTIQSQFNEELLNIKLETMQLTLKHIGNELHTNIGALASLIKINLLTIPVNDTAKATEKLHLTSNLMRQLISDIKLLSVSLNDDGISQKGLLHALQSEVDRINKTKQFKATIQVNGHLPLLDDDKGIILYRMVQEVLRNMEKHSNAQTICIVVIAKENTVTLLLEDDGVGFNIYEKKPNGYEDGLRKLKKRAELLHAKLSIESSPGNGSKIKIVLPYDNIVKE